MATDEKKKGDGRTVLLKLLRLSFTESLKDKKKTSEESDKESHGCNFILEANSKTFEENKKKILSAIRAACEAEWPGKPDKWKDIQEDSPKRICFRKGASFKNRDGEPYQGYAGNYAITAKGPSAGQKRPQLLDRLNGILEGQTPRKGCHPTRRFSVDDIEDIFYGGSYCDAVISFYGTEKGSAGVFASIELIRSHQEGERMGGGSPDLDPFLDELEELEDDGADLMATGSGEDSNDLF